MADAVWLGGAAGRAQVSTITIGGTWVANDTITLTIGAAQLVLTLGSTSAATTTLVATAVAAMIEGDTLGTGDSRTNTGNNVGQFAGLTATSSAAVVTVKGRSDGTPFTLVTTESGGTGTATDATTTAPTGPYHWDNVKNWLAGSVPIALDTLNFDHRAANGVKYAINLGYAPGFGGLTISDGFSYGIGLDAINTQESGYSYPEYRQRYLELNTTSVTARGGNGPLKFDFGTTSPNPVIIARSVQASGNTEPTVLLKGTNINGFILEGGDVGIAWDLGTTITVATITVSPSGGKDARLYCGAGVTISTSVTMNGGEVTLNSNPVTMTISGGTLYHSAGAMTTLNQHGGTVVYLSSGTLTTANVYAGLIDFSRNLRSKTVTNFTITKGAGYRNANDTVTHTNGLDLYGCNPSDLSEFSIPRHKTITLSAI